MTCGSITAPDACFDTSEGTTDSWGDGCEWYENNSGGCSIYDDSDFMASEMCCGCNGGVTCQETDDGAKNIEGNDCSWYVDNVHHCGFDYDTIGFCSNIMCCACVGGTRHVGDEVCEDEN